MEDLRRQEGLRSRIVTPSEAKERGLVIRTQPPETVHCKFCGKELPPEGLVMGNMVIAWKPFPTRCGCEKSKKYWENYDRLVKEKEEQETENERNAELRRKIERLLEDSGIKKRFRQRTFRNFVRDTPARTKCYTAAKEYADHFESHKTKGEGLYIEGTNGTGKTHLAAAIALQLIGQGIPVICKTGNDLLMDIKRAFDNPEIKEHEVLDIYRRVDLLVIDDLGKEQCSDWSISTLYSILNDRYENMKPTIITTNYNADGLIQALTPKGYDDTKAAAIVSRLRETSSLLTMAWEDRRVSH